MRRGKGFSYIDAPGKPVRDPEEILRIKHLAIPPAWSSQIPGSRGRGWIRRGKPETYPESRVGSDRHTATSRRPPASTPPVRDPLTRATTH